MSVLIIYQIFCRYNDCKDIYGFNLDFYEKEATSTYGHWITLGQNFLTIPF